MLDLLFFLFFLSSREIFILRTNLLLQWTRTCTRFPNFRTIPIHFCIRVNNSYCSKSKLTCFSNEPRRIRIKQTDHVAFSNRNTSSDPLPRNIHFSCHETERNPLFPIKKISSRRRWRRFHLPFSVSILFRSIFSPLSFSFFETEWEVTTNFKRLRSAGFLFDRPLLFLCRDRRELAWC